MAQEKKPANDRRPPNSPDKDRPSTWKPYRPSHCQNCWSDCCAMPVEVRAEDLVRLGWADETETKSPKNLARKLEKEKKISSYRESTQLFMLTQKPNGDCLLLDSESRRCTVYENRPEVCREFPTRMSPRIGFCPAIKKNY